MPSRGQEIQSSWLSDKKPERPSLVPAKTKDFKSLLLKRNTKVDKILFCPFHVDGIIKKYKKSSDLRKPKIGMFKIIDKKWKVDKKNSFMIGDQLSDIQFAKKAKIKGYLFKGKNLYNFIKKLNL